MKKNNIALTIAGSDSGAGAGIQADLKTFTVYKVYVATVITAITAQNTIGVREIFNVPYDFVEKQIKAISEDFNISFIKIGMLSNLNIIKKINYCLEVYLKNIPIILDPVMIAKGGQPLIEDDAIDFLIKNLIPKCYLLTPNIPEAETILNTKLDSLKKIEKEIEGFSELGVKNILVKGGHLKHKNDILIDVLCENKNINKLYSKFIKSINTHGTGCSLSSAITANLYLGKNLLDSVVEAQNFVYNGIKNSFIIGQGHNPINHFYKNSK